MSSTTSRFGAVASAVFPPSSAPSGCNPSFTGTFEISTQNVSLADKRDPGLLLAPQKRGTLTLTLNNSILHDTSGRTGYIAANDQFQFDGPPQAGAIFTAGFSLCSNGSLALGDSCLWYQCLSGTFYNLYDESQGGQCNQIYINAIDQSGTFPPISTISSGPSTGSPSSIAAGGVGPHSTGPASSTSGSGSGPAKPSSKTSSPTAASGAVTTSDLSSGATSSAAAASASASSTSKSDSSKTVTVTGIVKAFVTFGIIASMLSL